MRLRTVLPVVLAASFALARPAAADPLFFPTAVNTGSFARAHALPELGRGAVVKESIAVGGSLTASNEFYTKGTALRVDAETLKATLHLRAPLADRWETSFTASVLNQGGGALDGLIEGWHDTFGLPNGNRERASQDDFRIRYLRDGKVLLDLDRPITRVGDVQFGLGWQATEELVLRGLVQLPTGRAEDLSGGHGGAALWADFGKVVGDSRKVRLDASAGASLSQVRGPLAPIQKSLVGYGRLGVAAQVYRSLQGQLGVQLHSPLYDDTGDRPISGSGGSLSLGVGFVAYGQPVLLTVEEDVLLNSGPDLVLKLAVGL